VVTLQDLKNIFQSNKDQSLAYNALGTQLARIANTQIRSNSTVGGNIVVAEWDSDLLVSLMATNATATVINFKGQDRTVPIHQLHLGDSEVLLSVSVPKEKLNTFIRTYKFAPRNHTCCANLSSGCQVTLENNKIVDICLAFSGVGVHPLRASNTETFLKGNMDYRDYTARGE